MDDKNEVMPFGSNVPLELTNTSKIGKLLVQMGKISPAETERILKLQKKEGLLFGDAAIKLGLIKKTDIKHALSLQFDYPYLEKGQGGLNEGLVAAYEPFSKRVEAIKALRGQLKSRWFEQGNKVLSIVAPSEKENSSLLAANLAITFAQLGEKTLLIDANMRKPKQKSYFNLNQNLGLSDLLASRTGLEIIQEVEGIDGLSILGSGTLPPNPQELLGRSTFFHLINLVADNFDVVIVDVAPSLETADAQVTIARCGGALIVSKLNHTHHSDLKELSNQIQVTGAKVVGAVVTEL